MIFSFKRLITQVVLVSFLFQSLWPRVVFASYGGVDVLRPLPLPSLSPTFSLPLSRPPIAIKPFSLQAFVDDRVEGYERIDKKPVVCFPGAASLLEAQEWFETSLEAQALYPGLLVTEQGLLWSQFGLNFLMSLKGHLFVAALPGVKATTETLRLHNYHGDIIFGGGLFLVL